MLCNHKCLFFSVDYSFHFLNIDVHVKLTTVYKINGVNYSFTIDKLGLLTINCSL